MTERSLVPAPNKTSVEVKRAGRQMRHLAQSIILEESGTSSLVRAAIFISCAAVLAFLVWASFTRIDEIAVAPGQVLPADQVQLVQHFEGGIVAEILVREGELVEAGQPLIRMSQTQALGELEQMRVRDVDLTLRAERLRAFAEGREPDFSGVDPSYSELVADQMSILRQQLAAQKAAQAVLESQIAQRRSEISLYRSQQQSIADQVATLAEEYRIREGLNKKQLVARVAVLEAQRELSRAMGEQNRLSGQIASAQQSLAEAENRLLDSTATAQRQALDEMGAVTTELLQVREALARMQDRVSRLDVVSPVRGLVQGLRVRNAGAVVSPGGEIVQIVPVDNDLGIEARIAPRDIGHVAIGQQVSVKFTSFDFARYGAIEGVVDTLSPTTFMDEQNQPYYKANISLEKAHFGDDPSRFRILPGMTVQADVVTGSKTLLQYLLKPIYVSINSAFRER